MRDSVRFWWATRGLGSQPAWLRAFAYRMVVNCIFLGIALFKVQSGSSAFVGPRYIMPIWCWGSLYLATALWGIVAITMKKVTLLRGSLTFAVMVHAFLSGALFVSFLQSGTGLFSAVAVASLGVGFLSAVSQLARRQ